jgi:sugar O-acyltransferase (sialic acid O-acetyltransferase NeuD family)
MKYYIQRVPMISVNDEEINLISWLKLKGNYVKRGEIICELESSKATFEVEAEEEGYLFPLINENERAKIGDPLAIISPEKDVDIDKILKEIYKKTEELDVKASKKWTKKAEILAKKYGVNIEDIPAIGVIQEADVINYIKRGSSKKKEEIEDLVRDVYPGNIKEKVLILGGGRGCVQVLDAILRSERQEVVGILDDNESLHGKKILGIKILGPISLVYELKDKGIFDKLVISFSNDIEKRAETYENLKKQGFCFANVIDRTVQIHSNVEIGTGNVIMANCRIGSCSIIGDNNFLSAFVNIEHHNIVGSHCTFGPGVMTSSRVQIGDKVKFGTGIFIEPGIKIGSNSIISSGSILTFDVPENSIVKKHIDLKISKRE